MKLLVISNHPPDKWEASQKAGWDQIDYIQFPAIPPEMGKEELLELVDDMVGKIENEYPDHTVTIQGEFGFTCGVVSRLSSTGREPIFPTTKRVVEEEGGVKISTFKFVQWR